jgi:hypothetical protein
MFAGFSEEGKDLINCISWRDFWIAAAALGWKDAVDSEEYKRETEERVKCGLLVERDGKLLFCYQFTGKPRNILDEIEQDDPSPR